jgi:hypothetical protein
MLRKILAYLYEVYIKFYEIINYYWTNILKLSSNSYCI